MGKTEDALRIIIMNFHEFNPRKDRKKHHWFRVDNTIPFSRKLEALDPDQKWLWICLIALASHDQKDWVDYDLEYLKKHSGVSERKIQSAIFHFQKEQMIQVVPRSDTERLPSGVPTDRQTDRQTDNKPTEPAEPSGGLVSDLFVNEKILIPYLEKVPVKAQESWVETYDKNLDWVTHQLKEAVTWILANPTNAPKSQYGRFFTGWLRRNWEWSRGKQKTKKQPGVVAEL